MNGILSEETLRYYSDLATKRSQVSELAGIVFDYYDKRGLKFPDAWRALGFLNTELAEVYEILLARDGGWVRNNPGDKPAWDLDHYEEELGDLVMMAMVAGLAEGVDPVAGLLRKMERKLKEKGLA